MVPFWTVFTDLNPPFSSAEADAIVSPSGLHAGRLLRLGISVK
jgi:hypothetical protein